MDFRWLWRHRLMADFSRNGAARSLNPKFPQARIYERDLRGLEDREKLPPFSEVKEPSQEAYYVAKAFLQLIEQKHGVLVRDIECALSVRRSYERAEDAKLYRRMVKEVAAGTFEEREVERERARAAHHAALDRIRDRNRALASRLALAVTPAERSRINSEAMALEMEFHALRETPEVE